MENSQNTPPHAELHIVAGKGLRVLSDGGFGNVTIECRGCFDCLALCIAEFMTRQPRLKEIIHNAIQIVDQRAAQNGN